MALSAVELTLSCLPRLYRHPLVTFHFIYYSFASPRRWIHLFCISIVCNLLPVPKQLAHEHRSHDTISDSTAIR